jgi:hypothetical protein
MRKSTCDEAVRTSNVRTATDAVPLSGNDGGNGEAARDDAGGIVGDGVPVTAVSATYL